MRRKAKRKEAFSNALFLSLQWIVLTPRVLDMAAACPVSATVNQVGLVLYVMCPEPSARISATATESTAPTRGSAAVTPTGWVLTAPRVRSHQPFPPPHLLSSQAVLRRIPIFHFNHLHSQGGGSLSMSCACL